MVRAHVNPLSRVMRRPVFAPRPLAALTAFATVAACAQALREVETVASGLEDVQLSLRQAPKMEGRYYFGSRIVEAADGQSLFMILGERYKGVQQLCLTGALRRDERNSAVSTETNAQGEQALGDALTLQAGLRLGRLGSGAQALALEAVTIAAEARDEIVSARNSGARCGWTCPPRRARLGGPA